MRLHGNLHLLVFRWKDKTKSHRVTDYEVPPEYQTLLYKPVTVLFESLQLHNALFNSLILKYDQKPELKTQLCLLVVHTWMIRNYCMKAKNGIIKDCHSELQHTKAYLCGFVNEWRLESNRSTCCKITCDRLTGSGRIAHSFWMA